MRIVLAGAVLALAQLNAWAACPSPETMASLAANWTAMTPAAGLDKDMSMADAMCGQKLLHRELAKTQGRVVGYKAGLTNAAVQKRFGADGPVRGTLFEKMIVADGAELPAKFGTRPVMEADLVVEVADEGINAAATPAEVLAHVSKIIPFLELPDLTLDTKEVINGATLTAMNVGTRLGVAGKPIPARAEHLDALAAMTVVLVDRADGDKELAKGPGTAILDHPLNAVIWLVKDLARDGGRLKAGDWISLGSFTPLMPPKPGMAVQVRYEGFPGTPTVGVKFR